MLSNISYQQPLCCSQISCNINVILDIQIVWATIRYIVCEKEFTIICDQHIKNRVHIQTC